VIDLDHMAWLVLMFLPGLIGYLSCCGVVIILEDIDEASGVGMFNELPFTFHDW
jgi:hypothetical protein